MLDVEAGVLGLELVQGVRQLLLVPTLFGGDGEAVEGYRALHGAEVVMVLVVGIVEHGVEVDIVHPGDGQDIARHALLDLDLLVTLEPVEMGDLDGLAGVADQELAVGGDTALVDAEDPQLAAEGVVDDLEHMGQDVQVGVRLDHHRGQAGAFALHEGGGIALRGVRHEAYQDLQQFRDTGAGLGG